MRAVLDPREAPAEAERSLVGVLSGMAMMTKELVALNPAVNRVVLTAAVQGYRIEDWKALSNESLVIRTNDGKRYRATLMGRCIGLKFTDTIAFVTRGERTVDRFAGIMLPDGSRCYFKTFEAISQPTDRREARRP